MEFNNPSEIVKELNFGQEANSKIMQGVEKLSTAVKSTLGASGKCVIYEDALGRPVITKDGVTVAESVVLLDPVENIGATLIKEAARNTVQEAGDGTTTSTVLAHSILKIAKDYIWNNNHDRVIKDGILSACDKVINYLDKNTKKINKSMLNQVAAISCNNDSDLGNKIAEAFKTVGKDGVVLMEDSDTNETYVEFVDGVQFDSKLKSPHLVTDKNKNIAVLDNPYVLIVSSPIPNIRRIQNILEHVIKKKRSLLVVAEVEQQPLSTLLANKVKGNIKVNIVDLPGFGPTKEDTIQDLAILTGATVINEQLGDDFDFINAECLGEVEKAVTDDKNTVLQVIESVAVEERIKEVSNKIKEEKNGYFKKKLEQRLSMLTGKVGIIKVAGNSKIELKEKKDRVEDAIYATKAAYKEGIVAGGGVALLDASYAIIPENEGETVLLEAIKSPYSAILDNAALEHKEYGKTGIGIDVVNNKKVNMIEAGIIDPVLVTKSALKNAVSVATTILSADCIISNIRVKNASA